MMSRVTLLRVLLIAAALPPLAGALRGARPRFANVPAALPPHSVAEPQPVYETGALPRVGTAFVHGGTLAELSNGDLAAAFYGGSDEVKPDVAIFFTVRDHRSGRWSAPRRIMDRYVARRALRMPVKSIGNPVLYADARGLRLFFVAIVAGGWSGGTIAMTSSGDAGVHWSDARHLITSPLFNVGMLVRAAPVAYDDGTVALPVYHEAPQKWSAIVRVDRDGRVLDQVRIRDSRQLIQPWMTVTGAGDAFVFFREPLKWGTSDCVRWAATADGGSSFSNVAGSPLVHRDSAVAATRMGDGSILVLWNNSPFDRRNISMARGFDGLRRWSKAFAFISDATPDSLLRREYSYPFPIRTRDGRTHFLFTHQRTSIHHTVFNDAWIEAHPVLSEPR
jgi:predicted neuraminidase